MGYALDSMASPTSVAEGVARSHLVVGAHATTTIDTDGVEQFRPFASPAHRALQRRRRDDETRNHPAFVVGGNPLDAAIASGTLPDSQRRTAA